MLSRECRKLAYCIEEPPAGCRVANVATVSKAGKYRLYSDGNDEETFQHCVVKDLQVFLYKIDRWKEIS